MNYLFFAILLPIIEQWRKGKSIRINSQRKITFKMIFMFHRQFKMVVDVRRYFMFGFYKSLVNMEWFTRHDTLWTCTVVGIEPPYCITLLDYS